MGGLGALAWRSLAAAPVRSVLTVLGVALGTAVLVATVVTADGADRAVDLAVTDAVGRADLTVGAFGDASFDRGAIEQAGALPGVAVAAPSIERRTYLLPDLTPDAGADGPVAVLGIDPVLDPQVRSMEVIEGSALVRDDEQSALVSHTFADAAGLTVGDPIELLGAADAPPGTGAVRIVGIVRGDGPVAGAAGRTVILPIGTARALFGVDGATRLDLVLEPDAEPASVADELGAALATPYVVTTPAELAASLRASTSDFLATMALVAAVALFAGAFLVFNTLSMTVTERAREVALLRAAGATRGQVVSVILRQAVVLGLAGGIVGLVLGVLLAALLAGVVRAAIGLPALLAVSPVGLALAALISLGVTLAAALEPALRAGRVSPVEALRSRADQGRRRRAWILWLLGVAAIVALAVLILGRGLDPDEASRQLVAYASLVALALLAPVVAPVVGRLVGLPFAVVAPIEERLARGALARDPGRTGLTVGALTVALTLVVALATVAADARRSASAWLEGVVPGDAILVAVAPIPLGEQGPTPEIAAVDGVERVSPIATFAVAFDGFRLDAAAVSGADLLADGRLTFVDGDRESALAALDDAGSVVLPASMLERFELDLGPGDRIELQPGAGPTVELEVAGIVERGLPGRGGEAVLVGWSDATAAFGVTGADSLAVRYADGSAEATAGAVADAARLYGLEPVPLAEVRDAVTQALGRIYGLLDILALVAVAVAALGIVNTLAMSVVDRVREIGVLRATGMTRRQVRRMVVVESGILGGIAVVLGILGGLAVAVLVSALSGEPVAVPAIPWPTLGLVAALGLGVAMLAAWYPARTAAALPIVRAVRVDPR
ncbi:MAG TPA: FtsX-like permease family protein [Candidatus Limnocylindrales bacterium]|nr:FtsX-like permease family protein [Candidatus Limnocylindrales bacterium]